MLISIYLEKNGVTPQVYLSRINGPNEKFLNKINMKKITSILNIHDFDV